MHAVAAFFASIIAVVSSVFTSPVVAPDAPVDSRAMHAAAAAATQIATTSNPFLDPSAPPVTPADTAPAFSPPPPQTVINQPVIERIIERAVPQGNAGISADKLTAILTDFGNSIEARLTALNPPKADIPQQVAAAGNAGVSGFFPASQRIDQLSNTAINTPTITGGAISGASSVGASSGSFDALAAGTLALSGTLTGTDATFSGTLSAGTLNVAGLSSQGALIGPYFTATSTTATSSFAGGLTAANGGFSILQNGNVGIGTQNPTAKLGIEASGTNGIDIRRAGSVFGTGIRTFASRGTTAAPTQSQTNDTLGNFEFWGLDDTGVYRRPAYISAKASENLTSASSAGYLSFFTAPTGSVNATERLRIDASGNVGIGTTTPGALLSAAGNILGAGTLALTGTTGTTTIASGQGFTIGSSQFVVQQGSGNVGLGATSPTGRLHILTGTSLVTPNPNADELVVEKGSGDGGITIANQSNAKGILYFGDPQNSASGRIIYDHSDDSLQIGANSGERLRITAAGNVGIGTTTPQQKLAVSSSGDTRLVVDSSGSGSQSIVSFQNQGVAKFEIKNQPSGGSQFLSIGRYGGNDLNVDNNGNVGIGTTTPTAQLSTTGTVRFAGLGSAGANLVTDALGNVTASSDERLKDKQGDFTRGLAAINAISPVLYKWRPETGFDTQSTYAGFFAQNVQTAIPEAVSQDSRGHLTLADRPVLAALVNAVKELAQRLSDFAERVVTKEIVATNGSFRRVNTGELCVDDICVTREQFAAMVAAAGQTAGSPSPTASATLQAPAIELNGNASSTIKVGDTYNDLGAYIVAPTSDLNLGLVILLDGATTTDVTIDTTTPGEHTILYTVSSPTTGLTSSIIRTVIVSPANRPLSPEPANDNPFNAAPGNDNTSSTNVPIVEPTASI